jgi:hypothetical protein
MDGKAKLEKLVNTWYGFGLFTGMAAFLMNGIGILSAMAAVFSTAISLAVTFVLGRLLFRRSTLTRWILVVLSGLSVILGVVGVGGAMWSFFSEWSFALLVYAGFCIVSMYVNAKSFSILTDRTVKGYFAR